MQIRQIGISDLPRLEGVAREFYALSGAPGEFDMKRFVDFWELFLPGTGAIFTLFDDAGEAQGAIGGLIYPDVYSGVPVATEFFWFIRPEHRGRGLDLYYRFEQWARSKGAAKIRMAHLCNVMPEGMKVLFDELGFDPVEVHYSKELVR